MVFNDLRFYLCRFVELECAGLHDRRDGKPVERRADEPNRRAAPLSRPGQTAAGAGDALGLLRVFTVSDHLVRQSSGRDSLVSRANAWRVGCDHHHSSNSPLCFAPFLFLLSRDLKRNPHKLVIIAGLVLVMRVIDLWWMLVPAFSHEHFPAGFVLDVRRFAPGGWRVVARVLLLAVE